MTAKCSETTCPFRAGPQSCSSGLSSRCLVKAAAKCIARFPKWKGCVETEHYLTVGGQFIPKQLSSSPSGTLQKHACVCCGSERRLLELLGADSGHRRQSFGKPVSVIFLHKQHKTKPLGLSFVQTSNTKCPCLLAVCSPSRLYCCIKMVVVQIDKA